MFAQFAMTPAASPRIWLFPLSVGQEGNIRSWTLLFSTHHSCKYLFLCASYIRFWLPQCIVQCVFPATPWPAFFFVAPIKFVLVSRVTRMTIHKWNKKVKLYRRFYSRVYSQVQARMSTNKKVLSRSDKFLFRRANAIKNASLNLRTGDFLTITNTTKRLMICLVDNL